MSKPVKKILKQRLEKRIFLKRVRNRLKDEIGEYFKMLAEKRAKERNSRTTGFWTGVRLLMPVIDAISSVLMRKSKKDSRPKSVRFMERKLGIKYPYIMWEMFRNTLIHGDEMRGISYRGSNVSWGLSIGINDYIYMAGHISLDVVKLYIDLLEFLDQEILTAKGHVYVENHVRYLSGIKPDLKKEILAIQK